MKRFWADLDRALVDARRMSVSDAASMIETRFDKYCDLWPHIEAACASNIYYHRMLDRAFAVRYMLDQTLSVRGQRT
jgi:hypothetical protein